MLLNHSVVSATDWYIDNPIEDDVFEASDNVNAVGTGPADAEFTVKIFVAGDLIKSESCTVGSEDFWSECRQLPMGAWANSVISLPGDVRIYEGHGNGDLLEEGSGEFYASGGQV